MRSSACAEQGRDAVRRNRRSALVDKDRAIAVPVEGDSQVRAVAPHRGDHVLQVLGLEGIGLVIRECPVGLEVQSLDHKRKPLEERHETDRAHSVAAVDGDAQGRTFGGGQHAHVFDVGGAQVAQRDLAAGLGNCRAVEAWR